MKRHECGMTTEDCNIELCMHATDGTKYLFGTPVQAAAFRVMTMMDKGLADVIVGFIDLGVDEEQA